MSLVNYLGTYETLDQVWEAYPEGGKEGDYLYIASVLKKWNKYTSAWADPTEEDVEGSTIVSLEEDVVVGSSTLINYLGRFETLGDALNAYPEGGNEGDYIYVGDDIYAWDKYANEWVVSSDAPLEVAISEEDIIPNSNTFINYLGGFVDRDAVWQKYPEGGKVGDYLYIASDLHIWDKYICNWVAATPPDESSQIRPIEVLTQEGVVEYSENYINYLGVFESIEQAWEAYPEGGKEGDYIIVGGEQLRWNKYTSNWGEYDPDASTPARPVATIYGDLHVHNDVVIGEDLYARILETFTTKKWVLEQGYISLNDVTSELVMSKIVPDNTTIEVRDGKLVVIGGSGGGTADSVAWDNITGKPDWIGDTKPTYTLDEIAGNNGDGFVTLLSNQTIEGVKNFANGAKFNGALLSYDEEKKAWVFPGNIIASGGITAFGSLSTPVASLFEALPIDGITIKRDPVTNELYVDTNVLGGSGGGSLDEEQLEEYLKPYAKTADVANTYATKSSVNALSTQLNDFLSGSDTDTIINKWSELETFLAGLAETDDLATILSGKANKATTLAGYGITDAYTKSHIDGNFVTIGTKQEITGEKDFVGGFKVNGGLVEYNATLKTWVFNGDLLVTGGMSAFSNISGFKPSTITEAVLIDNKTIKLNADGLLYAVAQGAGGINEDQLADYLTTNGYATQSWVTGRGYITASALEPYALKTAIPTKLSQLTDDVVSGKYLSIAGGTVNGKVDVIYRYGSAAAGEDMMRVGCYVSNPYGLSLGTASASMSYIQSKVFDNSLYTLLALNPFGGNVVIGGITASEKLEVHGNVKATSFIGNLTGNAATATKLKNSVSLWGRSFDGTADLTGPLTVTTGEGYRINYNGYDLRFIVSGSSSNRGIWDNTNNNWLMYRSGSNDIYFTSGNIGFGTTSPTEKVTVTGNIKASGALMSTDVNVSNTLNLTATNSQAFNGAQLLFTGGIARIAATSTGKMYQYADTFTFRPASTTVASSIGVTIDTKANISTTGNMILPTGSSNFTNASLWFGEKVRIGANSSNALGLYADYAIRLSPNSGTEASTTEGLWLLRSGFNGFNISNPTQALHVNGKGIFADATNPWISLQRDGVNWYLQVVSTGLKLGRTSALGVLVDDSGNMVAPGGVTATNSSDRRLKKDIRKFNASKVLMSLGAVWEYEYIDSEVQKNHIYEGTHFGLIYQHVKGTKLDVMCHEREDGMGALNYIHPKFISLIAGATMENISEVEKLKRKIRTLEAKVKQLEQRA